MRPLDERILHTLVLWLAVAGPAGAQARFDLRPSPAFALFRPAPAPPVAHPISFIHSTAPDYRWEGLAIGAIAVGTLGAVFVLGFCNDPDAHGSAPKCALGAIDGFLFGATIGGVTGGLLGGLIPKGPPKAPPDSTH